MLTFGLVLTGITVCILVPVLLFCIYLYFLTIYSLLFVKVRFSKKMQSKFAIIIPINKNFTNIDKMLAELIQKIDYPDHLYDIVIVTDNLTKSEQVAIFKLDISGVRILHYSNSWRQGREFAIEWALAELLKGDYSAFFIMNQNSKPEPWILKALDYQIIEGESCIQLSADYFSHKFTWGKRLLSIYLTAYHHVMPKGKAVLGLSSGLTGNGVCFSEELLYTCPYKPLEYKNWFEYHIRLVLQKKKVKFIPKTALYNDINSELLDEYNLGNLPLNIAFKRYIIPLYKSSLNGNLSAFDTLIALFLPSLKTVTSILIFAIFSGAIVFVASSVIPECEDLLVYGQLLVFVSIGGIVVLLFLFSIGMLQKKMSPITWLAGFFFPIYGLYFFVKKLIKL